MTLSFLHPEDVGDYSCTATNAHGNNTRSVYLEVRFLLGGEISDTDMHIDTDTDSLIKNHVISYHVIIFSYHLLLR